jgi:hypothetical protein
MEGWMDGPIYFFGEESHSFVAPFWSLGRPFAVTPVHKIANGCFLSSLPLSHGPAGFVLRCQRNYRETPSCCRPANGVARRRVGVEGAVMRKEDEREEKAGAAGVQETKVI